MEVSLVCWPSDTRVAYPRWCNYKWISTAMQKKVSSDGDCALRIGGPWILINHGIVDGEVLSKLSLCYQFTSPPLALEDHHPFLRWTQYASHTHIYIYIWFIYTYISHDIDMTDKSGITQSRCPFPSYEKWWPKKCTCFEDIPILDK